MPPIRITFANQKGGVAKTTSTANVGAELARRGHRVLLVDMDAQGSLTYIAGHNYDDIHPGDSLMALLVPEAVTRSGGELPLSTTLGCDLLPAHPSMRELDLDLPNRLGPNQRLRKALPSFDEDYDFVLIDSGPKFGPTTLNTLVAADYVVVPVKGNVLSLRGLQALQETVEQVRTYEGVQCEILGLIGTLVKAKTKKALAADTAFRGLEKTQGFRYLGLVRSSIKVEEADDLQRAVRDHKEDAKPVVDYANVTSKMLKAIEEKGAVHA